MNHLWLCPMIGLMLGSIPFGLLLGRLKGIDIREHGSGNIGATNVWRVLGKGLGLPCFILDVAKGAVPTLLALSLIQAGNSPAQMAIKALLPYASHHEMMLAQSVQVLTGLCAILGHNYSPWVRFKGGKGIATSAGVLLALMPFAVLILIMIWLLVFRITRYVSVASIAAAVALPVLNVWGIIHHGKWADGTWNRPLMTFSVVISVLAIYKHRSNIARLRAGTENRFDRGRSSKNTSA